MQGRNCTLNSFLKTSEVVIVMRLAPMLSSILVHHHNLASPVRYVLVILTRSSTGVWTTTKYYMSQRKKKMRRRQWVPPPSFPLSLSFILSFFLFLSPLSANHLSGFFFFFPTFRRTFNRPKSPFGWTRACSPIFHTMFATPSEVQMAIFKRVNSSVNDPNCCLKKLDCV